MYAYRKPLYPLASAVVLMFLAACSQAATLYVPSQYPTIQAAIDAAAATDTIVVAAGTYHESLSWGGKDLIIQGVGPDQSMIDPSIANGGPGGRCLTTESLSSATRIEGFTFQNGSERNGGGMYNVGSSPTLTNCIFRSNTVDNYGGGMYNSASSPILIKCTFIGNAGYYRASGMYNENNSNPTLINCTLIGNGSSGYGGGMFNVDSSPTLLNCTLWGNSAYYGGAMYNYYCRPTLTNCIVWGNPDVVNWGIFSVYYSPNITYSDLQAYPDGTGTFSADPLFVDPTHGDFHLQPGSPCINAGNNAALPASLTTDLDGNSRIAYGAVDLGVYEVQDSPLAADVTTQVQVTRGGFRKNLANGHYVQTVTLKNIGTSSLTGTLSLVLDNISSNASLTNQSAITYVLAPVGSPYLNTGNLAPGASATLTLEFNNPTNQAITYTTRLLAGIGVR